MENGKRRAPVEHKRVDDKQLGALVKRHHKDGASATSILQSLRTEGISVAGKRVRTLFKQMTGKRGPGRPKGSKRQVA